ncbi:DUF998 domain-containing protein [Aeromicrobium sp. YIM 150415]|uniref:DUF998 domain-containing protein n=1 Tax=Aeromicrobium sp. YIM 150415 TaxID=2803912 RepID=UPI0019658327|nr:DUF998 domain-containing protein [Aeromicrobium sp. YIM 150415]MBM9465380.1 DUF998 domain-containing protein [Aeromicrobium sp. YIM 150415]
MTTDQTVSAARPRAGHPHPVTRALLIGGAVAGPLFYLSALVQMAVRDGFDLRVHPLSQLATGEWGRIQMLTFVLVGLGLIGLSAGHRRVISTGIGRGALPLFIAIGGTGFIAAGLFPQDPSHGFPLGTPDGPAAVTTWHASVHIIAAIIGFSALAIAAALALVRAIRQHRPLAAAGNAVVALVLLVPVDPDIASIQVAVTGLFAFGWCTATAVRLLRLATAIPTR